MLSSRPDPRILTMVRARGIRRRSWGFVICAVLMVVPAHASAQEQVPGTATCELDHVTLPLFDATPAAIIAATPASTPGAVAPTVDSVTIDAAIEVIVTCISSSDPGLRYAVFTDRYLAEQLADTTRTYQPAFEQQLELGINPDVPRYSIESIEQSEPLDDGRVAVVVTLSADGEQYQDRLVLANVDGVWLIDDVEVIDPATPSAGS